MKHLNRALVTHAISGAAAFWIPDIIWGTIRGDDFSRKDVNFITILMPTTLLLAYLMFRYRRRSGAYLVARGMLLGIWLLGPLAIGLAGFASGGGLAEKPLIAILGILFVTLIFPVATLIMSVYDGSLGALGITTAVLALLSIKTRRDADLEAVTTSGSPTLSQL